jgi:transcriptional regulator with XRE-family HTH domain
MVSTDFGLFLKNARLSLGYSAGKIASAIRRSNTYVLDVENGKSSAPEPRILRAWLHALHMGHRYEELIKIARENKRSYYVQLQPGNPANPHLAEVIEKYQSRKLTEYELSLLFCLSTAKD